MKRSELLATCLTGMCRHSMIGMMRVQWQHRKFNIIPEGAKIRPGKTVISR